MILERNSESKNDLSVEMLIDLEPRELVEKLTEMQGKGELEGFRWIGIEKEKEYINIAQKRIDSIPEPMF